ncbi:hypothetical protein IU485_02360 [Nocardia cyriacigeorgica]|uniref:hypothetical protein n=1 Tax=Nocardia cyriacigeorgica TaxID=135487 RepID=UPI001894B5AE|nr:hypothetical protein [Nocardia cyriacigeorgica]MBF6080197.1 hypothetical protein [Nocardia cyriacigeorgica]
MFVNDIDTALTLIGDALAASNAAGDTYYRDMLYFTLALIEISRGRIDTAARWPAPPWPRPGGATAGSATPTT